MHEVMTFWCMEYLGLQGWGDDMLKPFVMKTALVAIPLIPFLVIPHVVLSMFMI